ncbi:hypothetical protein [Sphingobium sp. Z007]|nr:hypothetical protein [Sphingobium sp. Z007]
MSRSGHQVFWLQVEAEDYSDANAQFRAWLALGHDDVGDLDGLSTYKKGQWNAAYRQALQLEALKLAYKSEPAIWLTKQDVAYDVNPFATVGFANAVPADVKITVENADDMAALFKLTFAGRA